MFYEDFYLFHSKNHFKYDNNINFRKFITSQYRKFITPNVKYFSSLLKKKNKNLFFQCSRSFCTSTKKDDLIDGLTHIDKKSNQPTMVDVSGKNLTSREAHARCFVILPDEINSIFSNGEIQTAKGPVFSTAIVAGTMAVKKTSELIPFCHPLFIEKCKFNIQFNENLKKVQIDCVVVTTGKTGVEMEALTGCNVAALTVYDMCKALSHKIVITDCHLVKKTGGKSDFKHE